MTINLRVSRAVLEINHTDVVEPATLAPAPAPTDLASMRQQPQVPQAPPSPVNITATTVTTTVITDNKLVSITSPTDEAAPVTWVLPPLAHLASKIPPTALNLSAAVFNPPVSLATAPSISIVSASLEVLVPNSVVLVAQATLVRLLATIRMVAEVQATTVLALALVPVLATTINPRGSQAAQAINRTVAEALATTVLVLVLLSARESDLVSAQVTRALIPVTNLTVAAVLATSVLDLAQALAPTPADI
jgi:hypothetical protein